ncbi:MAG: Y-family DNA polymerase [Bacteroidales bacterium]|nr:Y-family DNA polymerase [Bacteroidales bacterium]
MGERTYIAIDLKSFYASVECAARGLDPLTTNLVVADSSRTDKTICLAVSPSLKAYGIPGRPRLFEVKRKVRQINEERRKSDPSFSLDFLVAKPRMALYMEISGRVYEVYLKYIAPEDIHVYSIDEVFIDATQYLSVYSCSAHDLAMRMIRDVLAATGITATAGIGTNLYLAKVAMDIVAKHTSPDEDGVRVASLDEYSYRRELWDHTPLTDFWRVGHGISARLEAAGINTMGDLARRSLDPAWEAYLYKTFGVNAELLIDHAWGWEPCTMELIKKYRPSASSLGAGQVLMEPYTFKKARVVAGEMVDSLVMDLVAKRLVTDQIIIDVGYEQVSGRQTCTDTVRDWYGRTVPKPAHGSVNLGKKTSSTRLISKAALDLFDRIVNPKLHVRRLGVTAANVTSEDSGAEQLELFSEPFDTEKERREQEAIIRIRGKFGKNAILKGMNFEEGATARERNQQIGGHKA